MENFSATGKWRLNDNDESKKNHKTVEIDPSGAFYKGPSFANFFELRDHILDKNEAFARGFTEALNTNSFGGMCLMARRLVERGVRFIQLYSGAGSKWDAHTDMEKNHSARFKETDQPVAALLTDLKQRGLLDDTLVVWGGEFGRTPMSEKGGGRDHNPTGFTMWMAGGGTKGGQTIGKTDEFGLYAVEDKMHVHDLHATIMSALGVDHTNLIYMYKGGRNGSTKMKVMLISRFQPFWPNAGGK